ncbi:hypothetical protein F3I27_19770 [Pantoea sp. Bo_2]|nr:hypothetical protein F3I57_19525 [Pantoea sp. VH_3]KAA5948167.1 hypothetical protein F3I56_20445 [Pantoea sp. VH_25]KAA5957110.1 hypothetical protein F3I53_17210 [Pantoea sp. VH_16]KAA5957985.1 hypothetical protein F3I55_07885 [Pantoea sp. VH_24]KAA5962397.1 hypothetical protein F3I54_17250 [Pantoea sp. VH_18]KAA5977935.1 hypothetical protein F3I48_20215 [Pantoea sp. M_3]KAA5998679.1 hypothetical protein F3I45_18710 [Pantoea sp. F_7]KAA6006524.1 hypothetical protein F3I43_18710 [Pantoea s
MGAYACSKASRRPDKNAGSVFEQRNALARLRAHLRDEVRHCPCRAGRDAVFCVFAQGICPLSLYSDYQRTQPDLLPIIIYSIGRPSYRQLPSHKRWGVCL